MFVENLSDIILQTDDGQKVFGHKAVLVIISSYFRAMFPNIYDRNKDFVNISIDSTTLKMLVDYMYTGEITVTIENVKMDYVKDVCAEFLQKQLNPSNCLGIKAFADLHNSVELLSSCEAYIKKQFFEVVEYDEFLSLSFEEVIGLISCNDLNVPFEEKVFESVIKWVQHELDLRADDSLPNLMSYVRLPLIGIQYILKEVVDHPLLERIPKCKDYVIEALRFNLLKTQQIFTIPQSIRSKPRQSEHKVFLVLSWSRAMKMSYTNWYDPEANRFQIAPGLKERRSNADLGLVSDQFIFAVGGVYNSSSRSVEFVDISTRSLRWIPMVDMLISRRNLGVGIANSCIYAIGGEGDTGHLNTVEVFDVSIQKWRMVSSMSTKRSRFGVGIVNNLIYAVGGFNGSSYLKSVECYNPTLDTWTPVAEMSEHRIGVGVGVLGNVMYAIGGCNSSGFFKCAEKYSPSTGNWTPIADMHLGRASAAVIIFNGMVYVMGGFNGTSILFSVEIYNPNTNTWSIKVLPSCIGQIYDGVVVNKPLYN
ncbi:kelch-like protein 2 isoform X2 [Metopolophium dirhodum]|uniref:kelch-like protein 2 isoform X2 n=1 Tax=Metopolophium dirhodum TaxID=44670 RepID=UPI0029903942|nr:kelch-like protein 2 isoform X2 [Metopolophium dirhodum]